MRRRRGRSFYRNVELAHAPNSPVEQTFTFAVLNAIEEFVEMTGIAVFVTPTLLSHSAC